jgi:hypothetical protein
MRRSRASKPIPKPRHEREGWNQKQMATLHPLSINPERPERHKKNQFPPTTRIAPSKMTPAGQQKRS